MITPLYYFKWMFQTYAYVIAGFSIICLFEGFIFGAIIFMLVFILFGFISDNIVGMDILRLENGKI